jgi:hypothetical protein
MKQEINILDYVDQEIVVRITNLLCNNDKRFLDRYIMLTQFLKEGVKND